MEVTAPCPCGSGKTYNLCCAPYVDGVAIPPTPESLMRSRYTAYTQANISYIQQTMKPPASNGFNPEEAERWATASQWLGLEVKNVSQTVDQGTVEFIATYQYQNKKISLHELSHFRRDQGRWFYIYGQAPNTSIPQPKSPGRNEPCPCGSGKKYKKCCAP